MAGGLFRTNPGSLRCVRLPARSVIRKCTFIAPSGRAVESKRAHQLESEPSTSMALKSREPRWLRSIRILWAALGMVGCRPWPLPRFSSTASAVAPPARR
jgi:hypothetical protein